MADSIGSYTLKASPEGIQNVAQEIFQMINLLATNVNHVQEQLNSTGSFWQGEAADSYRKDLTDSLEKAREWINYFRNYIEELNAIAATYTGVENKLVEEVSTQLSAEVII